MKAGLWLIGWCLLASTTAIPAQTQAQAQSGPPRIDDWVPLEWWSPVQFVTGLLNEDAIEDIAVVLERQQDAPEDRRFERGSRSLLVLYGTEAGGWRRGPMVPGMLPCTVCSGRLGKGQESVMFDLSISADGILEVAWLGRREGMKAVRLFIGWDSAYGDLGLLADDVSLVSPISHARSRVRRDYRAGMMWVDGEPRAMPPRFIPIEDVSAEQY